MHNVLFSYENPTNDAINIFTENDSLKISAPFSGNYMIMASQAAGNIIKDSISTFHLRSLYRLGTTQFVVPESAVTGKMQMVSGTKDQHPRDLLEVEVITSCADRYFSAFNNFAKSIGYGRNRRIEPFHGAIDAFVDSRSRQQCRVNGQLGDIVSGLRVDNCHCTKFEARVLEQSTPNGDVRLALGNSA